MNFNTMIFEKEEQIATITFNRPKKLNTLTEESFSEINTALDAVAADKDLRVLIITGGEKVFSAGDQLAPNQEVTGTRWSEYMAGLFHNTVNRIANLPIPVVAVIAGYALGGGCEFALACDIRIGSNDSKYGLPEIKVGVIPIGGGTVRLPHLVGPGWAKHLILTGDFIDADTAFKIGLITKLVSTEELMAEAKKMAVKLAKLPPIQLRLCKMSINNSMNVGLDAGLLFEERIVPMLSGLEDVKEGITAFTEKREPIFKGR